MERQKLYYVVNARMPTERAHGVQIAKMCGAFAHAGADVTLLVPRRRTTEKEDLFSAYRVQKNFTVEYLPTIDIIGPIPGTFALQTVAFAVSAWFRLLREKGSAIVYTRGEMPLLLAPFLPKRFALVWEAHIKPRHTGRYRWAVRRAAALVVVTNYFAQEIPALWDVLPEKVCSVPDGVDLDDFSAPRSKEASRARLGLPVGLPVALYIGRIDGWKGVDTLYEAAAHLKGVRIAIIGGDPAQVDAARAAYPAIRFFGYRPYAELCDNQAAADVLVLTGDPKSPIAQHYTSPLKLFTYLASGVPLVAADLPAFRDILSERNAFLCEPTAEGYAAMIQYVLAHPTEAHARAMYALEEVKGFSWNTRAEKIIDHITSCL